MNYLDWKQRLRQEILEQLDFGRELEDEEVLEQIDKAILDREELRRMPVDISSRLRLDLFDSLRRLDILQNLVEDAGITEIMINGPDNVFIEREGRLSRLDTGFESVEKLKDVIQQIVAGCNRVVNEASPIVDARLKNGARVNVVLSPIALNGPIVTIRRFPDKPITMEGLIQKNSLPHQVAEFLKKLVTAKYNIFISGGTGSGKTKPD